VSFDVTHSLQLPGTQDGSSGGRAELLVDLMKSVVIQGIACIFIEFHPNPKQAKCDAACAYPLDQAFELLSMIKEIDQFAKKLHTVTSIPS
jgi:2-dehydro-3-deoxyphosphooctonate aldolase (KDO 8-P synthase)